MATANETLELVFDTMESREVLVQWPHELRVRFEFLWEWPASEGFVQGLVVANEGNLRVEYGFLCFGRDLALFMEAIRRFHATLDGQAMFVNAEGSFELRLIVRDRGRGCITPTIRMERLGAAYRGAPPYVPWIELDGFEIEQSYLPGMVERIRDFLDRTGISMDAPNRKAL